MNSHIRPEPAWVVPAFEGHKSPLEGVVTIVSRSAGILLLVAALVGIAVQLVF